MMGRTTKRQEDEEVQEDLYDTLGGIEGEEEEEEW